MKGRLLVTVKKEANTKATARKYMHQWYYKEDMVGPNRISWSPNDRNQRCRTRTSWIRTALWHVHYSILHLSYQCYCAVLTCRTHQVNIPVSLQSPRGGEHGLHHYYSAGGDQDRTRHRGINTTVKSVCLCASFCSFISCGTMYVMYAVWYEWSFVTVIRF